MTSIPRSRPAEQLAAVARLYHLLQQVADDQEFLDEDPDTRRIFYVVDADTLNVYANPYQDTSLRYMRLFEPRRAARGDERSGSLFYAAARVTTDELFTGRHSRDVVLLPIYRRQVLATLRHYVDRGREDLLRHLDPRLRRMAADRLAAALQGGSEAEAFASFREMAPYFLLATMDGEAPAERLERALRIILKTEFPFSRSVTTPPRDRAWNELFSRIYAYRRHLVRARTTREDLEQNIAEDVDALVSVVALNQEYNRKGMRFLFLTGDSGIHRCVDDIYLRGEIPQLEWPSFNFVRRLVQLSRFVQKDCLRYSTSGNNNHRGVVDSFGQFLAFRDGRELHAAIYDEAVPDRLDFYQQDRPLGRVMAYRLDKMEEDILESRRAALILQAQKIMRAANGGAASGDAKDLLHLLNDDRLLELLRLGLVQHLSRVRALLEMAPSDDLAETDNLVYLLVSFASERVRPSRSDTPVWRRLPAFPRFPTAVLNHLQRIFEPKPDDAAGGGGPAPEEIEPGWLFLLNAAMSAINGDWASAAHQCALAVDYATNIRPDPAARSEFLYFQAVCWRHQVDPGADRLVAGLRHLGDAIGISRDPRFLVERAAYGLAIPYHQKHYGGYEAAVKVAPTPEETWRLLGEAETIMKATGKLADRSMASLRLRTQLHANACNVYLHALVLNPEGFAPSPLPPREEIERSLDALDRVIGLRGGEEEVSYLVRFILLATRALLLRPDHHDTPARREKLLERIEALRSSDEGGTPREILGYDRRKLEDFVRHFRSQDA